MSFKPEIEKIVDDILGPAKCYCEVMKTDEQFEEYYKQNPGASCPGCTTRDTVNLAIISYLVDQSSKDALYKAFQYTLNCHPLKMATLLDKVYNLKDEAEKFYEDEVKDAHAWNKIWLQVFGVDNGKRDK